MSTFVLDPNRKQNGFVVVPREEKRVERLEKCCVCTVAGCGEGWTGTGKKAYCGVCSKGQP